MRFFLAVLLTMGLSVAAQALELDKVECKDAKKAEEAKAAFARAKGALSRLHGVKSVSIAECEGFWGGKILEKYGIDKISPGLKVPNPECGVKVFFEDKDSLLTYVNSAMIFGTFIPYGTKAPPKRMVTCGALAE